MVKQVAQFDNQKVKQEAHFYTSLGWHPTPGKPQSKVPLHGKGWNEVKHTGYDEIIEQFNKLDDKEMPYNLGLLVGKELVDIDLDSENSRKLAPFILPNTIKLKKGNSVTHYLYHLDEGLEPLQTRQFPVPTEDMSKKEMMCELRGVDSRGNYQYTLASGSIHPSGLKIERIGDTPYTIKSHEEIFNLVRLLAFSDAMVRHWGRGTRSNLALGVVGFLLKNGYHEDLIEGALAGICEVAGGDPKNAELHNTVRKFENGQPVAGEKILKENLPSYAFDKIKSWFSTNLLGLADFDLGDINSLELEKRWPYLVYLANQSCFTCDGRTMLKRVDVNDLFARQLDVKSRNTLMAMSHKLNGLDYIPGQSLIVNDGPNTYWNAWLPTDLKPIEGDVELFLKHVGFICDKEPESVDALLSFMAHAVQRPEEKVRWMPLLIGGQGTGKTTLGDILGHLVGMSNFGSIPAADMLGNFNTPLKNKLVIVVEEMRISKSTQTTALATALKEKITNDIMLIKEKNVPEYYINNRLRFIGTSNHQSPIEIEPGDRRYYIIKSKTTGRTINQSEQISSAKFFKKYRDWLHNQSGLENILHFLLNYDLSKFTPDSAPLMSVVQAAKKHEIAYETTVPHFFHEVQEWCDEADNDLVAFRDFKEGFDDKFPNARLSDKMFNHLVEMNGGLKVRKMVSHQGKKVRVNGFVIRNFEKYDQHTTLDLAKLILTEGEEEFS